MADRARALAAICDSFVPGDGDLPSASALGVPATLRSEVAALARPALVAELDQLLDTIESPMLNLALTGRPVRFSALTPSERESYLKGWAASALPLKRRAFQVMKRLVLLYTYGAPDSPYAARAGYAPPAADAAATPAPLRLRTPRSGANAALERGANALGLAPATIARNVRGCGDCGPCTLGCRRGAKQSTLRTYLADACAAGAEILTGTEAVRLETANGRVTGVAARTRVDRPDPSA